MKRTIICYFLIVLATFVSGCAKTGYMIIMETNQIRYDDLKRIEARLLDKGFKIGWEERTVQVNRYPGEIYTFLTKLLSDKRYYSVEVYLFYVKEPKNNLALYPKIDIANIYKGMVIPEVKNEINYIGNLIYQELVDRVGKGNVKIERKEVKPPVIY